MKNWCQASLWCLVVFGILISVYAWRTSLMVTDESLQANFEREADTYVNQVIAKMEANFSVLRAVRAFYDSSQYVDRTEFHDFTRHFLNREEDIHDLRWLPHVTKSERSEHEQAARQEGVLGYQISDLLPGNRRIPAGDRPEYFPVYYLQSNTHSKNSLRPPAEEHNHVNVEMGVDFYASPDMRFLMQNARDNDDFAATGFKEISHTDHGAFLGVSFFYPVYEKTMRHADAPARRKHLLGFFAMTLNLEKLLAEVVEFNVQPDLDVQIMEGDFTEVTKSDWKSSPGMDLTLGAKDLVYSRGVEVANQTWYVLVRAKPEFVEKRKSSMPIINFISGLLITFILTFLLDRFFRNREQSEKLNAKLSIENRERRKVEEKLQTINQNLEYSVSQRTEELNLHRHALNQFALVSECDRNGVLTYVNDRFCEVSKFSREELIGQNDDFLSCGAEMNSLFLKRNQALKKGKIWRGEIRRNDKAGKVYWVDSTTVPLKDSQAKIVKYLTISNVITLRKETEQALVDRSEELERINRLMVGRELKMVQMKAEMKRFKNNFSGETKS